MIGKGFLLFSLIVIVAGILTTTWMRSVGHDNTMMGDPYFSMADFGICSPLSNLYTCVAHAWLAIVSRTGGEKTPIILPKKMTKKLAIVTGSNTGIGYETSKRLVREYGWDVILACRSKDKALIARNKINNHNENDDDAYNGKAIVLEPVLDLSDFDSIRKFVDAVQNEYDNVDVLINNAGRNTSGRSPGNPKLDLMFQSNYLGHFLLTDLLLKNKLLLSPSSSSNNSSDGSNVGGSEGEGNSKVINLSSVMHHFSKGDATEKAGGDFESIASPGYWKRRAFYHDDAPKNIYSASKLAAILHSIELNRRYGDENLTAIAVNPGSVNSDIWRGFPNWVRRHVFEKIFLTTEEGSEPIVAAAVRNDFTADNNNGRGAIIYLQPYANPFSIFGGRWFPDSSSSSSTTTTTVLSSSSSKQGPMLPFTEMCGPYVGHLPTIPRLPANAETAAETLWKVSEELTEL